MILRHYATPLRSCCHIRCRRRMLFRHYTPLATLMPLEGGSTPPPYCSDVIMMLLAPRRHMPRHCCLMPQPLALLPPLRRALLIRHCHSDAAAIRHTPMMPISRRHMLSYLRRHCYASRQAEAYVAGWQPGHARHAAAAYYAAITLIVDYAIRRRRHYFHSGCAIFSYFMLRCLRYYVLAPLLLLMPPDTLMPPRLH